MENESQVILERIFEPRLTLDSRSRYVALIGAMSLAYTTRATTSVSQTRLNWTTINPPGGVKNIVGRKIYITTHLNIVFNTAAGTNTTNILQPGTDGLRAYPYTSCLETIECKLNGRSITTTMSVI